MVVSVSDLRGRITSTAADESAVRRKGADVSVTFSGSDKPLATLALSLTEARELYAQLGFALQTTTR